MLQFLLNNYIQILTLTIYRLVLKLKIEFNYINY